MTPLARLFLMLLIMPLALLRDPVLAEGERAGEFDYYVMAMSWSPNWCAIEGDEKRSPQCRAESGHGWVLHGLWPQYHRGWPSYCRTTEPQPTPAMTAAMADIMGTPGLAWHQWRKHGVCSGLSARAYFDLSRRAYDSITRPAVLQKLERPVRLPARLIEEAFLRDNPGLTPDMLTVTCREGRIQEARICLSKDLNPVPCGRDVARDCSLQDALFDPLR
jgi:ribonuclease T2